MKKVFYWVKKFNKNGELVCSEEQHHLIQVIDCIDNDEIIQKYIIPHISLQNSKSEEFKFEFLKIQEIEDLSK
jgi:hypothetical protein